MAAELAEGGTKALFVQADVGDVAQAQASVGAVITEFGRVDCLVNAAGLTDRGTLLDTTPELFDAHIAVNLQGPFFLMQAVVADLVAAPGARHHRQHHQHVGARRPALPGPVRRRQGRAGRPDPQRGARPPLGPDPDQRPEHRLDRHRGRGRHPAPVPRRRRRLAGQGRARCRWASSGRPDEIADFVVFLLSDRSGVVTGSVIDWDQNVLGGMD